MKQFAGLVLVALVGQIPAAGQEWPPVIKNLQVLPQDTPAGDVLARMRGFSFALGVRCQHCHVGEEGMPIHQFDFAADAKESKAKARSMLQMTSAINDTHLASLGDLRTGLAVTCTTCHRGVERPEPLAALLARTVADEGVEVALARYRELRNQHYGSASYDFSEGSLVQAAEQMLERHPKAAVAFLELNAEQFPESMWTLGTLAGVYERLDRPKDAVQILQRMLRQSPDDPRLERQIERLEELIASGGGSEPPLF